MFFNFFVFFFFLFFNFFVFLCYKLKVLNKVRTKSGVLTYELKGHYELKMSHVICAFRTLVFSSVTNETK